MRTLVVYDIPDDRLRTKIFEACKDYGLTHIQYSAFLGDLNQNRRQELGLRLRRTLGDNEGKILICPVCDKDWALVLEIVVGGQGAGPETKAAAGPLIY